MKRFTNNPVTVICLLICLCGAALVALVTAHAEPPVNPIQACYNDTNGGLRRVNSPTDLQEPRDLDQLERSGACRTSRTGGAQGPAGPAGPGANVVNFQAYAHRRQHLWSIQQLQFHGSAVDKWQR